MRACHLAKWIVASFLFSVLAACGGGSTNSGCISGGTDCDAGETIDAMGTDGPLVDAIVRVLKLQEGLSGVANSVLKNDERSDAFGLANDIELKEGTAPGPFLLQITANSDGTTTDLTTGEAPVISQVATIITAADFAQNPRPRFYATAFTTLAIERAKVLAVLNTTSVEAELSTASIEVLNTFGFRSLENGAGLPKTNTIDIFHTAPILDENTTSLADQQKVAAYRTALETFAVVVKNVVDTLADGTTSQAVFDTIRDDFKRDGFVGNAASPLPIESAVVTEVNKVDNSYLSNSGRLSVSDIETLLDTELDDPDSGNDVSSPLFGGVGSLTNILPQEPDFDGDGSPNTLDSNDYDPFIDEDLDGISDIVTAATPIADNCIVGDMVFGNPINAAQAFNPAQTDTDGTEGGDACDEDADGDSFNGDGAGGPGNTGDISLDDPDDQNALINPGNHDSDTILTAVDNCPLTDNQDQAITGASPFGDACDTEDDGFPDTNQDVAGVAGEIGDNVGVDVCPNIADPAQSDSPDNDGVGDLCDLDDDNDGISDLLDPAPIVAVSNYHFDLFYTQQSSQAGGFKLATVSESVLQVASTAIDLATNSLDLGGTGNYDITSDYETIENSINFSNAAVAECVALAGPGCLENAVPTTASTTTAVSTDDLGNAAAYSEPDLSFSAETPATTLSPWGVTAFVGAGKITLNGVGATLTTSAEQGLASLLYTEGTSAEGDLDGTYGFVDLTIDYNGGAGASSAIDALVSTTSRVFDASFDGNGAITAQGAMSSYEVAIGNADGSVTYSTDQLGVSSGAYSVTGQGATTLSFDTETLKGIASALTTSAVTPVTESELIVLSEGNRRGYGVKLDTFADTATAGTALAGAYNLQGLVVQPALNKVLAYDFSGATLSFSDDGSGSITASLNLAGGVRDSALFDAEDDALPTIGTEAGPFGGASEPFTVSTSGRFGPVVWGVDSDTKPFEVEGFIVAGKGVLLRYVESSLTEGGGASVGGVSFFCGVVPGGLPSGFVAFVDPNTDGGDPNIADATPVVPQPTSGYQCGFVETVPSLSKARISDSARAAAGSTQTYSGLVDPFVGGNSSFGQGIIWGIPQ